MKNLWEENISCNNIKNITICRHGMWPISHTWINESCHEDSTKNDHKEGWKKIKPEIREKQCEFVEGKGAYIED